jgi:hypothetical protein
LYGHNLAETYEADLKSVVKAVKKFLHQIGVNTTARSIRTATVTSVEYSRNIQLQGFCSSHRLLEILSRFNYRPRSEFSSITRGTNSELKFWNKNSRLTVYDKLLQIKDCPVTNEELEIARCIVGGAVDSPYRVLTKDKVRFELALQKKEAVVGKMKQFYRAKRDYTLTEIFKDSIRDTVLKQEVTRLFNYPLVTILLMGSGERLDLELIEAYTQSLPKRQQLAHAMSMLRLSGLAGLRDDITKNSSNRTWIRINNELKRLSAFTSTYLARHPTDDQIVRFVQEQFGIVSPESNTHH